jgi:hypothetical protein
MVRTGLKLLGFLLLALPLPACDPVVRLALERESKKGEAYFAGLRDAQGSAPVVQQFLRLFPAAQIRYRWFGRSNCPGFDGFVVLHGRYELTMQLPVDFDDAGRTVVGYGEPQFYLLEITQFERLPGGPSHISYGRNLVFGSEEWEKVISANGDFRVIGWTLVTNEPVPGIDDAYMSRQQ